MIENPPGGGESSRTTIPPGPEGIIRTDFPRNRIEVGIPVIQDLVISSKFAVSTGLPLS